MRQSYTNVPTIIALLIFIIAGAGIYTATAGGPQFWRIDNFQEGEKSDLRGLTVEANGSLTLAPTVSEVFDTKQAYIWSVAADGAGNIYLGTGNEGRVYRVDSTGKGALFYQSTEVSVMALATDAAGNIYAGTSPEGKVYRITPGGESKVFFEPKSKYIWGLAFDRQGRLLVATGDRGVLYRVAPDGTGTTLATISQSNLTALRVDEAGNAIVGTDPGGMVVRVTPEGRVFTLFDSDQREIHDLAVGRDGAIYALALAESAGSGASSAAAPASTSAQPAAASFEGNVTVVLSDVQVIDSPAGGAVTAPGAGNSQMKSLLYQIDPNGAAQPLWESREAVAFALSAREDGGLLIGTGQKGRILAIRPDRQSSPTGFTSILANLPEGQVARLIRAGDRLYAASSNLGKLFAIGTSGAAGSGEGMITSKVHDSSHHASWGRLDWTGEGRIEFQTRSGNTADSDQTWSEWSKPITPNDGKESARVSGGRIESQPARYLQWRATLRRAGTDAVPRLREVTISYLPRNLAPRLTTLTALPVGVSLQPAPQQPIEGVTRSLQAEAASITGVVAMPPRRVFQQGAVSLQWQAEDRNSDQLEYSVHYRAASAAEFYPLRTGLRENYLTIESRDLPDGRYVFKVTATDRLSNPASLALVGERETEPIFIDNSPPQVTITPPAINGQQATLNVTATDATSTIRRAEYQLDGGQWLPVFPLDGLADSRQEQFSIRIDLPDSRPHLIAVRLFDANSNIGGAVTTAQSRPPASK